MKSKLKKHKVPIFPFYNLTCDKIKKRCKFNIREVCPLDPVMESDIPILFIHGDKDEFVPCAMSVDMYREKNGVKGLYIVKDAMHNTCYSKEKLKYEEIVERFLNKIMGRT